VPVRVHVPAGKGQPGSNKITFTLKATDGDDLQVSEKAVFFVPRNEHHDDHEKQSDEHH
jgi:hypothetical protein